MAGYSASILLITGIIFLIINLISYAYTSFVDVGIPLNIFRGGGEEVYPHVYAAPVGISGGGLTIIWEGVMMSLVTPKLLKGDIFLSILTLISLLISFVVSLYSIWIIIKAVSVANKINVVESVVSIILAYIPAFLGGAFIFLVGILAKLIILNAYTILTGAQFYDIFVYLRL